MSKSTQFFKNFARREARSSSGDEWRSAGSPAAVASAVAYVPVAGSDSKTVIGAYEKTGPLKKVVIARRPIALRHLASETEPARLAMRAAGRVFTMRNVK